MRKIIALIWLLLPGAYTTLSAQSAPPVYDSFEEIGDLFDRQNDTTYVINFWATWCKPCMEEMPYFEQIHDRFGDDPVEVILISLDFPNQIESKVIPYLEEAQLRSTVLVLTDGKYNDWIPLVEERWDGAIPITLVYRNDRREFVSGAFHSFAEIEERIASFLK